MAAPNLTITLTTSDTCDDIELADSTSDYGGGTVTTASITGCVIVVNLSGGQYMTFTFTILTNVIQTATLGLNGETAVSILSSLESTVFPFVATPFEIWRDYDVEVPEFADQVVEVDYTITGSGYSYTTSLAVTVPCVSLCCCITTMGQSIDPECDCCEEKIWAYLKADTYLTLAIMNTEIGNTDRAQLFIDKASVLCEDTDCGCD